MAMQNVLVLIYFLFSFVLSSSVPIIVWWYDSGMNVPSQSSHVLSGHTLKLSEVYSAHLKNIIKESKVVVLFLQDQLSVDDFTKYSTSFPFLKSSLESQKQFILPFVSQRDESLYEKLKNEKQFHMTEIFPGDDWVEKMKNEDNEKTSIFAVHLEPVGDGDSDSKGKIFKKNDEIMKAITNVVKKYSHASILYTSTEPSKDVSNMLFNEQVLDDNPLNSRHLLATKNHDSIMVSKEGILMALKSLKMGQDPKTLVDFNFTKTGKVVNNTITFDLQNGVKEYTMSITLKLREKLREWTCGSISIKNETFNVTFHCGDETASHDKLRAFTSTETNTIVSPWQYSFACSMMQFGQNEYYLRLEGFQIQPNITGRNDVKFLEAYNCVGFFSLTILMGLLIVALLISSLFIGTYMMMGIQTQDRFDDPKGKTITVQTGE